MVRAWVKAALATALLAASGCAQRVAPPAPGPSASETTPAGAEQSPPGAAADTSAPGEEAAKQALRQLFDHCQARAHDKAAGYFLYNGSDEARRGKASLSMNDPAEAEAVKTRCDNLASLLESGGYAIVGYTSEKEAEGTWHRVQVSFSTPGQPTRRVFSVREVGDAYLLGDVE